MKTSNKILLGLIAFIGLFCLCFLIYVKANMIDNTHPDWGKNEIHGSGEMRTSTHNGLDFTGLDISGVFEVMLVQGPNSVVIKTDKMFQGIVKPMVEENILTFIMETDKELHNFEGFQITVSAENLEEISISGNARLITQAPFNAENIILKVHSISQSQLELNAKNIKIYGSGNAALNLKGNAETMNIEVHGPADINALQMKTSDIVINAGGISHTKVYATEQLDITAADAAEIIYEGKPRLAQKVSGVAKIIQNQPVN